jgi:hypothetical protein
VVGLRSKLSKWREEEMLWMLKAQEETKGFGFYESKEIEAFWFTELHSHVIVAWSRNAMDVVFLSIL